MFNEKQIKWHLILISLIWFITCRTVYTHYALSTNVTGSIPDKVIEFFNWPNPSSCYMALGSAQPVTEMSTRNLPRGKGRPTRKADNLTTLLSPRPLTGTALTITFTVQSIHWRCNSYVVWIYDTIKQPYHVCSAKNLLEIKDLDLQNITQ
jgi:hypothetical protein